jgi:hypothetical protein
VIAKSASGVLRRNETRSARSADAAAHFLRFSALSRMIFAWTSDLYFCGGTACARHFVR